MMEPNGATSSNPARVQLPSIKNLVDTLPPPNAYRTLQVAPEFAPLSQRRTIDDGGGFSARPTHASPAPPSRSAAALTNTASYGHGHGQQEMPYQTSTNDVIQARTSRMSIRGASAQIPGRVNQDQFHSRSSRVDSPPSVASSASIDHRRYSENFDNSPGMSASQHLQAHGQGQRQGQGSYGLSSNPLSRGFGDISTSALISTPDRDGGSHRTVQDLRALSSSETQSRAGRLYLKPHSERVLPLRNGQEYDDYDAATPTAPSSHHAFGAVPDWDRVPKANSQPSRYREGYDTPAIDHARYRPESIDQSQHLQRRQEPVNYQERRTDAYPSRGQYNLEPARWQRDHVPPYHEDGRNPRDLYHSSGHTDTRSAQGRIPPRAIVGNDGWETSRPSGRSSGRRPDHSEQENQAPRPERLHSSLEIGQFRKRHLGDANDEWPYTRNGLPPSSMQTNHRPVMVRPPTRHRSKEEFPRVLTELKNEAIEATTGGEAMKKIHEFSTTVAHFGSHAQQQASHATIEDLQEMSLRIELIFRMARELQKGKKQIVATPVREEPVIPQQKMVAIAPKKNVMTKEEKRMLEDMEKIRKKRTSAQQGIKSKYMKRNKKTQPPKKCSSCGIKETPEWRKGPEGPRSLCNACGLHYAKLMRNRSSANEGKWIGNGSAPPIDIVTLRQVTGVGIQPQANERGEYEIPGIYTHIPPSRMLQGNFIQGRKIPPQSASTSQPASQGQASTSAVASDTPANSLTSALVNGTAELLPDSEQEPGTGEGAVLRPSSAGENNSKKRKAASDDEDTGGDEVPPPSKRPRVSSPQIEDVQMEAVPESIAIDPSVESARSPHPNDSSGERSF